MRYAWILFDADGTLFDYDRAEASALERTFAEFGVAARPGAAETYRRINGEIWQLFEEGRISAQRLRKRRFELLAAALGVAFDPAAFSSRYLENLAQCVDLIDGAEQVLEVLHDHVGLMLITNGLKEVQRSRLGRSSIGHFFADVVISEEVGAAKPDPRIFDVAFQRMGRPRRAEVLMVGDSLSSDMRGGIDYGIDTCWFNPGQLSRDPGVDVPYEIHDLRQLVNLVMPD